MDHHRHTHSVFISVDYGACATCQAPAAYGWFFGSNIGGLACAAHAPADMVAKHTAYQSYPKEGCIYCDNPSQSPPRDEA